MNNKGQVLTIFILLIPVILILAALVIDLGLFMTKTYKIKQSMKQALEYVLEKDDLEGGRLLLRKNIGDASLNYNGALEASVEGVYNSLLGRVIKNDMFRYKYKYIGYKDNGKIIIREE